MNDCMAVALPDPWLTGILGEEVFRVVFKRGDELSPGDAVSEFLPLGACLKRKPIFAYAKVPSSALWATRYLEDLDFRLVDTHIVFEKKLTRKSQRGEQGTIRFAEMGDKDPVVGIAQRSFAYSRFHADPFIPKETADRIKGLWAANYFTGERGDSMVVALDRGVTAGFLQLINDGKTLVIDLIAVGPAHRGKGLARKMIWFAEDSLTGFARFRVGTQLANIPSVKLYESLEFRFNESAYIFHYHNR